MLLKRSQIPARLAFYVISGSGALIGSLFVSMTVFLYTIVRLNPLQLVLVGTVLEGSAFLFEVPTGLIADTFSRRLSILLGYLALGISFILLGLTRSFAWVLVSQVIASLGNTFLNGATEAWLAGEVGEEPIGGLYLRAGQISRVCGMVGLAISAALASIHLALPILIGGTGFLVLGLALALVMPEAGFQPRQVEDHSVSQSLKAMGITFKESLSAIRGRPVLTILVMSSFLIGTFSEGMDRLGDAHLVVNFAFPRLLALKPVVWFSIIAWLGELLSLAITAIFQRRLEKTSTQPDRTAHWLIYLNLGTALCVLGFSLAGSFTLAVACLLVRQALLALIIPLNGAFQVQNTPAHVRATVLSMCGQSNALGQVLGGPLVGWVGATVSLRVAIFLDGLLIVPLSGLYARARRFIRGTASTPLEPQLLQAGED